MGLSLQIAKHFRDVFFGGNWTDVNLKSTLSDVNWQQAITKVHNFNTIALLVFHINYYISGVTKVLQGGPLDISDKYSFDMPPIQSQQDWEKLVNKTFADAELFASLIEQMPEEKIVKDFPESKYGSYYRNINGIIEHTHYHLGQIVLIKKLAQQEDKDGLKK
jgi:hypothetical protein